MKMENHGIVTDQKFHLMSEEEEVVEYKFIKLRCRGQLITPRLREDRGDRVFMKWMGLMLQRSMSLDTSVSSFYELQ